MKKWGQNVKKRRLEQMRMIQQGITSDVATFYPSPWEEPNTSSSEVLWSAKRNQQDKKKSPKWVIQLFIALLLSVFTFTVFQSQSLKADQVQRWMLQWMNQPFHFQEMSNWYEKLWGGNAAILPTFSANKGPENQGNIWVAPVRGTLALPFSTERKGVLLQSKHHAKVNAPAEGLVIFAGERKGLGKTVVIQHANGKQTWFGFLGQVTTKEKTWIKKGTQLGDVGLRDGKPFVYIAYRENGTFVNPMEVMPFAF